MIGLKMRKKIEGWSVDTSDVSNTSVYSRIADNNKLWIACFIVVLLVSVCLVRDASRVRDLPQEYPGQPGFSGISPWDDQDHKDFASNFLKNKAYGKSLSEAYFDGPERFNIIIESTATTDEIEYAANIAANLILKKFKQRVVVAVYSQNVRGERKLVATTSWDPKRYGIVVKLKRDNVIIPQ